MPGTTPHPPSVGPADRAAPARPVSTRRMICARRRRGRSWNFLDLQRVVRERAHMRGTRWALLAISLALAALALALAGAGCGDNAEGPCGDTSFCNGIERVVDGRCIKVPANPCDDFQDCTMDVCHEDSPDVRPHPDGDLRGLPPGELHAGLRRARVRRRRVRRQLWRVRRRDGVHAGRRPAPTRPGPDVREPAPADGVDRHAAPDGRHDGLGPPDHADLQLDEHRGRGRLAVHAHRADRDRGPELRLRHRAQPARGRDRGRVPRRRGRTRRSRAATTRRLPATTARGSSRCSSPARTTCIVDGFDASQFGPYSLRVKFAADCVPNCDGQYCGGDDGCGGNCGTCADRRGVRPGPPVPPRPVRPGLPERRRHGAHVRRRRLRRQLRRVHRRRGCASR